MEGRTIVPKIVTVWIKLEAGNIAGDPADSLCRRSQSLSACFNRLGGQIQHSYISVSISQQVIDQSRTAAADIDNRRRAIGYRLPYQGERTIKMRRVPTRLSRWLAPIDLVPVLAIVHDIRSTKPLTNLRPHQVQEKHEVQKGHDQCSRYPRVHVRPYTIAHQQ